MGYLTALFAVIARLCRPSRGVHAPAFGYLRELLAEARTRRASRVRRYAHDVPTVAEVAPLVPAPRRPADTAPVPALAARMPLPRTVPVVDPLAVAEPADIVRGYYRAFERRQERARAARVDRSRLGLAVLTDLAANATREGVSA